MSQRSCDHDDGGSDHNEDNDAVYDFSRKTIQTDPRTIRLLR